MPFLWLKPTGVSVSIQTHGSPLLPEFRVLSCLRPLSGCTFSGSFTGSPFLGSLNTDVLWLTLSTSYLRYFPWLIIYHPCIAIPQIYVSIPRLSPDLMDSYSKLPKGAFFGQMSRDTLDTNRTELVFLPKPVPPPPSQ